MNSAGMPGSHLQVNPFKSEILKSFDEDLLCQLFSEALSKLVRVEGDIEFRLSWRGLGQDGKTNQFAVNPGAEAMIASCLGNWFSQPYSRSA